MSETSHKITVEEVYKKIYDDEIFLPLEVRQEVLDRIIHVAFNGQWWSPESPIRIIDMILERLRSSMAKRPLENDADKELIAARMRAIKVCRALDYVRNKVRLIMMDNGDPRLRRRI